MDDTETCKKMTVSSNSEVPLRKGPWMPEEDEVLLEYVRQYGARDWSSIRSKGLLPRTGKSCRLRWVNKLQLTSKGPFPLGRSGCKFSPEEEKLVVEMQAKLGNKWAKIASYLQGRTDNDVKNFWSTRQKRIMRATQQHPMGQSASTDSSMEILDMIKATSSTGFSAFEVTPPASSSMIQSTIFGTPFSFAEASDTYREQVGELRKVCQNSDPFSSEIDKMLMVKLEDLVAGDSLFMDTDFIQPDDTSQGQGSSMSSMLSSGESSKSGPTKRKRNLQKRDSTIAAGSLTSTSSLEMKDEGVNELLLEIPSNNVDFGVDLYMDPNESNILDLLLQPENSSVQTSCTFSSNTTGILSANQQWEKLPTLCPDDIQISEGDNIKVNSSTPDTVLVGFPADVFDSLEQLSQTASDW
eukprot:Gb_09998 [translate_table: standard]